jgi:hypothetical protein
MPLILIAMTVGLVSLGVWTLLLFRMQQAEFWESQIRAFEQADRSHPPEHGAILFTGSSSIRYWCTLQHDMAPLRVINRGFGGCHLAHVTQYAERMIFPYRPRAIVLYAGENDLCWPSRKTPESVFEDFKNLFALIRERRPGTHLYYLSIKRALFRRSRWPAIDRANRLIREFADAHESVAFIDVSTPMLDSWDNPLPEYLPWYRIHMTPQGYALWTSIIRPVLERAGV